MSRVGYRHIIVPGSVNVAVSGNVVSAKGPKGELSLSLPNGIEAQLNSGRIEVSRKNNDRKSMALHGLNRMLVANMIQGVSEGYTKELEIEGVGFKASIQDRTASFSLGFSSPVEISVPSNIDVKVVDGVNVVVAGADKQAVGDFAARLRSLCPAEPYKGKGIRYKGERIRRKAGKTVA